MFKKFLEGMVFGSGFTISFIALLSYSTYIILPLIVEYQTQIFQGPLESRDQVITSSDRRSFRNQTTEEKIKEATAIVLVQFKPDDDGRMVGVITEVLKQDPDVDFFYKKGEEHPPSSFYPKPDREHYGSGSIVFFTGSPATMQLSAYFHGDQIPMLHNVSLPEFIEMCKKEQA